MNQEQQRMSAHGLISEALGLQISYIVLVQKLKEVNESKIERKHLISTGLAQSSNIIISFALEIALKGLLKYRIDNFPKTHNFQILFNLFSENDKTNIATLFEKKTNLNIEDCFEQYKNMFMDFRYLESGNNNPHNSYIIEQAVEAIIEYYNLIQDKQ